MNGRTAKKLRKCASALMMSGELAPDISYRQVKRRIKRRYNEGKLTIEAVNEILAMGGAR